MTVEVDCPKCGARMEPRAERTVHHEVIVELSCPRCLHREVAVVNAGARTLRGKDR